MASSSFTPPPPSSSDVSPSDREEIVRKVRAARMYDQHYEMAELMNELVDVTDNLTVVERDLLSVAYEGVIRRIIRERNFVESFLDIKKKDKEDHIDVPFIIANISNIESTVLPVCNKILRRLDSRLIPSASDDESKLFYLKMKGDYGRYLAEFTNGAEREKALKDTISAYRSAQDDSGDEIKEAPNSDEGQRTEDHLSPKRKKTTNSGLRLSS